jgi:hypothetical protein
MPFLQFTLLSLDAGIQSVSEGQTQQIKLQSSSHFSEVLPNSQQEILVDSPNNEKYIDICSAKFSLLLESPILRQPKQNLFRTVTVCISAIPSHY